ncbi:hypothetical protein HYALB_00006363 [Hymenoscyphus albidus]|uniref:Uncharacterized protein n=1 Tax=Hymenoscyphus albidus TaxID=595503 RepID=A0A9N9LIX8_9HELO|nr:hypothetical protein HYALB_00006363 [Hymenoscyphus albidus]
MDSLQMGNGRDGGGQGGEGDQGDQGGEGEKGGNAGKFGELRELRRGHKIEDPTIFVWLIDWASIEYHKRFMESEQYPGFLEKMEEVFDISAKDEIFRIHTKYETDYAPAALAPVTEIAFCSLPDTAGEKERKRFDDATAQIGRDVRSVGGAVGSGASWVLPTSPKLKNKIHQRREGEEESLALVAVFGYDSIETHMRWREAPEHRLATEIMSGLSQEIGLRDFEVAGGGMWHVGFRRWVV